MDSTLLIKHLMNAIEAIRPIVFVGIGTPRFSGDAFGPMLAEQLRKKQGFPYPVYGGISRPVDNTNYVSTYNKISHTYHNPFIVGMDASFGTADTLGQTKILIKKDLIKAKSGSHSSSYNDILIIGCTVEKSKGYYGLLYASEVLVSQMVAETLETILYAIKKLHYNQDTYSMLKGA